MRACLFLAIGNAVGAALSLILFSLTVVSFPLLLDRDVDFVTAMITSVRAVVTEPAADDRLGGPHCGPARDFGACRTSWASS